MSTHRVFHPSGHGSASTYIPPKIHRIVTLPGCLLVRWFIGVCSAGSTHKQVCLFAPGPSGPSSSSQRHTQQRIQSHLSHVRPRRSSAMGFACFVSLDQTWFLLRELGMFSSLGRIHFWMNTRRGAFPRCLARCFHCHAQPCCPHHSGRCSDLRIRQSSKAPDLPGT